LTPVGQWHDAGGGQPAFLNVTTASDCPFDGLIEADVTLRLLDSLSDAKAATNCLMQCAAIEFGRRKIRVNAILPGPIESAASRGLFKNAELRHAFEKEVPLGRIAQPEDIADAALWLAGPVFVTGLSLQVDGGMFLFPFPTPAELPGGSAAYEKRPG